jgi:anti-sigma-K factor RskA
MTHAEMDDLYELYALGALEIDEAVEIDKHVADNCDYCMQHIGQAVTSTAMLSGMQDPIEPPARVRQRLMAGFTTPAVTTSPAKPARRWFWTIAALGTACAALLALVIWGGVSFWQTRGQLHQVARERNQLREALQVLSSAQPTLVQFGKSAQEPRGTVFFNRNGGFVMTGSHMPQIASDKAFELWVIPKKGSPMPAGTFGSHGAGNTFVHAYSEPIDVSNVAAVAVTVEPHEGSLAPTTKPFLVVPIG